MRIPFFNQKSSLNSIRKRMIKEHAHWLTRAIRKGSAIPAIPVRRVSEGGFAHLMSTEDGRKTARQWWDRALQMDPWDADIN